MKDQSLHDKHNLVGKTYIARKSYPVYARGTFIPDVDFHDFKEGEQIFIKDFVSDEYIPEGRYLVWCLDVDDSGLAWVKLTEEEMLRVLRK